MAKGDEKKKSAKQQSRADAVRAAVDQAFQATADQAEGTQRRVQEIADDLTQVAGRLREALDGARPVTATDFDAVRADIAALTARVGALETAAKTPAPRRASAKAPAAKPAPARKAPGKPAQPKAPASRSSTAASKVPAARAAARRSAAKRPD